MPARRPSCPRDRAPRGRGRPGHRPGRIGGPPSRKARWPSPCPIAALPATCAGRWRRASSEGAYARLSGWAPQRRNSRKPSKAVEHEAPRHGNVQTRPLADHRDFDAIVCRMDQIIWNALVLSTTVRVRAGSRRGSAIAPAASSTATIRQPAARWSSPSSAGQNTMHPNGRRAEAERLDRRGDRARGGGPARSCTTGCSARCLAQPRGVDRSHGVRAPVRRGVRAPPEDMTDVLDPEPLLRGSSRRRREAHLRLSRVHRRSIGRRARSSSPASTGWPNSGHASFRHSQSCSGPPSASLAGWPQVPHSGGSTCRSYAPHSSMCATDCLAPHLRSSSR